MHITTHRYIKNSQIHYNNNSNKSKFLSTPLPHHMLKPVTYQIHSDINGSVTCRNTENLQPSCSVPIFVQLTVSSGEEPIQSS